LNRHLNQYALAAGAAGVGLIAIAQPAEAKIVYTKTHKVIKGSGGEILKIDLNRDGIADFRLIIGDTSSYWWLSVSGYGSGNRIWTTKPSKTSLHGGWAAAFPAGVRIGQKRKSSDSKAFMEGVVGAYGNWVNVKNRFLGLAFAIKGETHYGWARLNAGRSQGLITATLTGYAYETIPNKPIITGKTKGPDVITLEPGSLGRIAKGSAGRSGK
jgi:hypothetical protein